MRVLRILIVAGVAACGGTEEAVRPPTSELSAGSEGAFVDVALKAQSTECPDASGDCTIEAVASSNGKLVGFRVIIKSGMTPGIRGGEVVRDAFKREGIVFERSGPESDDFLAALAALYGIPLSNAEFTPRNAATVFPLEGDPSRIRDEPLKFKVFFNDSEGDDEYAELYVNLDLPNSTVELAEKDPEYRANVIGALGVAR